MAKQEEYKQVGTDAEGQPLYQKVEASAEGAQVEPSSSDQLGKYQRHDPEPLYREDRAINGYLYDNIAPEVVELRHQRSVERFPNIKLHDQEFVVLTISKHPLELALIWGIALMAIVLVAVAGAVIASSDLVIQSMGASSGVLLFVIGVALILLLLAFAGIGTVIHRSNFLVLTTEKLVQYVMYGLFNHKVQTVDLNGVEDVASLKNGLLQTMFDIGTIRMSTVGEESTYTITFVGDPGTKADMVNEVVQAVKNERPLPDLSDYKITP